MPVLAPPSWVHDEEKIKVFKTNAHKVIPDPSVYSEWFDRAPESNRRLAVGTRRYSEVDKLTGREPRWSDFVDPRSGGLVPAKTLRAETPAERQARIAEVEKMIAERRRDIHHLSTFGFLSPAAPETAPSRERRLDRTSNYIAKGTPEHAAIRAYVERAPVQMNTALREPHKKQTPEIHQHVENLTRAISQAPRLSEPVTVYRGAQFSTADTEEFIANLRRARSITLPGFTSTSLDRKRAEWFASRIKTRPQIIFEIEARHGLYVEPITNTDEEEFLLQHGTEFEILGIESRGLKKWTVKLRQIVS